MASLTFYFVRLAGLVSDWTVPGHPVVAGWVVILVGWYLLLLGVELAMRLYIWSLAYKIWNKK